MVKTIYDDFPADDKLEWNHVLAYVESGREIEFEYQGNEYFMSYSGDEGRQLLSNSQEISKSFGDDHTNFFYQAKIGDKTLYDIFKNKEAEVTGIL